MKPPFYLGESRRVPLFLFDAGQGRPGAFQLVDKLDPGTGIGLDGGAGFAVLKKLLQIVSFMMQDLLP